MGRNVGRGANGFLWLDGRGKVVHEQKVKMGHTWRQVALSGAPVWQSIPGKYLNTSEAQRAFRGRLGCHPVSPNREGRLPPKPPSLRLNGILILGFLGNMCWILFRAPPRGVRCRGYTGGPELV